MGFGMGDGVSMVNGIKKIITNLGKENDQLVKAASIKNGVGGVILGVVATTIVVGGAGCVWCKKRFNKYKEEKRVIDEEHQRQLKILEQKYEEALLEQSQAPIYPFEENDDGQIAHEKVA